MTEKGVGEQIVALGPHAYGHKKSGGAKRFLLSLEAVREWAGDVVVCSDFLAMLKSLRGRKKIYYAFDERYLLLGVVPYLLGRKVVYFPRGNKLMHYREYVSSVRLFFYKMFFSVLYRFCSSMVFQTEAQALEFKSKFRFKCQYGVLPNDINVSWVTRDDVVNKKKQGLVRIGFCGDRSRNKGFSLVLQAVQGLIKKNQVELHIAGMNYGENLGSGCYSHGYVKDMASFYRKVDVVVIPSEYDSFPNVFAECLYFEVPVLLAETDITRDIVKNGGEVLLFKRDAISLENKLALFDRELSNVTEAIFLLRKRYDFDWKAAFVACLINKVKT